MKNLNQNFKNLYKSLIGGQPSKVLDSIDYYLKYLPDEVIEKSVFDVLPPANRGVSSSDFTVCKEDFKLNCLVDWLTCSFSFKELKSFFKSVGCSESEFRSFFDESYRFKTKFYDNSFKFLGTGAISTGMIQKNAQRSSLLELTGSSIQSFRDKFNLSDLQLIKKLNYTEGNDIVNTAVKITRIDLTIDYQSINIFSGLKLWDDIIVYLGNKWFSSSLNSSSIKFLSSGGDSGHIQTIYLGSQSSNRFLCMYLKHEESVDKREQFIENFVIRFELRVAENHAYCFKMNADKCKTNQEFFSLVRSMINDFIEFKDVDKFKELNINLRNRLNIAPFWEKVFKTQIEINSFPVYKEINLSKKKKHAENCALTMYYLKETDPSYIDDMFKLGQERFIEKLDKNIDILEQLRKEHNRNKGV